MLTGHSVNLSCEGIDSWDLFKLFWSYSCGGLLLRQWGLLPPSLHSPFYLGRVCISQVDILVSLNCQSLYTPKFKSLGLSCWDLHPTNFNLSGFTHPQVYTLSVLHPSGYTNRGYTVWITPVYNHKFILSGIYFHQVYIPKSRLAGFILLR